MELLIIKFYKNVNLYSKKEKYRKKETQISDETVPPAKKHFFFFWQKYKKKKTNAFSKTIKSHEKLKEKMAMLEFY